MGTLSVDKLVKTSAGAAEFTLPATDGTAGQVWQTDGAGQLSVAALAADTVGTSQISALAVDTAEIAANAVDGSKIAMGSDAAGDVLYYNGTDYVRLGAGTANQTLQMNAGATAPAWVTAVDQGKVLQLLATTQNVQVDTTSTSYVATGLTITITPASTSSKFLLVLAGGSAHAASGEQMHTTFFVDGAEVSPAGPYEQIRNNGGTGLNQTHSAMCLHSPSTTSATTYAVYFKVNNGTGNWQVSNGVRTEFSVMELSS